MSLGIEIRKDLVWEFDDNGLPIRPRVEKARQVAHAIGEAITTYLTVDRREMGREISEPLET